MASVIKMLILLKMMTLLGACSRKTSEYSCGQGSTQKLADT